MLVVDKSTSCSFCRLGEEVDSDKLEPKKGDKVQYYFFVFHKPNESLPRHFPFSTWYDDFETTF